MPTQESQLVRVMSEPEILAITGVLPYVTSVARNWIGVEVHRYRFPRATDFDDFTLPQLTVFLPHVDRPRKVQQEIESDKLTRQVTNDVVTIAPAGLRRRVSTSMPSELTAIFLDPLVFSEIARTET